MTIPQIQAMKAKLHHSLSRMMESGVTTPWVECGRSTYEVLINIAVADMPIEQGWQARIDLESGKVDMRFMGVLVKRCHDVPEWSLWPSREISAFATQRRIKADTQEVTC
jgi:hypothetical protein